jgi:hypothetical protein
MANTKVSDLPEITTINDGDSVYVVAAGTAKRITKLNLQDDLSVTHAATATNADDATHADEAAKAILADKLTTARKISLGQDCSGNVNFDGSANVTLNVDVHNDSHNHSYSNLGMAAYHGGGGYVRLPTGTIVQWQYWSQPSDSDLTINFPIAFPNICRSVVITRANSHSHNAQHASIVSRSQWKVLRNDDIDGTSTGYMMCIGY